MDYGNISATDRFLRRSRDTIRKNPSYSVFLERQGDITAYLKNVTTDKRFDGRFDYSLHEPIPGKGTVTLLDTDGDMMQDGHTTIRVGDRLKVYAGFRSENIPIFTGVVTDPQVNTATHEITLSCYDYGYLLKQQQTSGDYDEFDTPKALIEELTRQIRCGIPEYERQDTTYRLNFSGSAETYGDHSHEYYPAIGVYANLAVAEYFEGGNILNAGTNDISISAWVNPDFGSPPTYKYVATKRASAGAGDAGYLFGFDGAKVEFEMSDGTDEYLLIGATSIDGWTHIAAVIDRSNAANCKVFLNGSDDTNSKNGTLADVDDIDNSENFDIGKLVSTDATKVKDVRVYIAAGNHWSDAEVLAQYNNPYERHKGGSMTAGWPLTDNENSTYIAPYGGVEDSYVFGNTELSRRTYWKILHGISLAIFYVYYYDGNGVLQWKRRDYFSDANLLFEDKNIVDIRHLQMAEMINKKGMDHTGSPSWESGFSLGDDVRWGEKTYTLNHDVSQSVYGIHSDYETDELIDGFRNVYQYVKEAIGFYPYPRHVYEMTIPGMPQLEMMDMIRIKSERRNIKGHFAIIGIQDHLSPGYYYQTLTLLSTPKRV